MIRCHIEIFLYDLFIEMNNDSWCDLDYVRTFGYDSFINNIGHYGNISRNGPIV
jgi:hypothetical protein